jgi:hypothetical protein
MVLVWFRKGEDVTLLGHGFGVSRPPRIATPTKPSRS